MADAEEKARQEKIAAAKKRVGFTNLFEPQCGSAIEKLMSVNRLNK
jgi:hypothetical protein